MVQQLHSWTVRPEKWNLHSHKNLSMNVHSCLTVNSPDVFKQTNSQTNWVIAIPRNTAEQLKGINCKYMQQLGWISRELHVKWKQANLKRLHAACFHFMYAWNDKVLEAERTGAARALWGVVLEDTGCVYNRATWGNSCVARNSAIFWLWTHKSVHEIKLHQLNIYAPMNTRTHEWVQIRQ